MALAATTASAGSTTTPSGFAPPPTTWKGMTKMTDSLLEKHGREGLIAIVKTALKDQPDAINNVRGSDAVSVVGWTRLLDALEVPCAISEPQWLGELGSVQVHAEVPNPYGGTQRAYAIGTIPVDMKARHIELSKIQSFALRRACRDGWLGLVLAAGITVGAEEEDDGAQPAPQRPQDGGRAPKPASTPKPSPKPDTGAPVDPGIAPANAGRVKVAELNDEEQLAVYDAAQAKRNRVWNDEKQTYEVVEG